MIHDQLLCCVQAGWYFICYNAATWTGCFISKCIWECEREPEREQKGKQEAEIFFQIAINLA